METRANYALIGLFTLAVIAAAFGFVYWFSGGERGQARQSRPNRVLRLGLRPLAGLERRPSTACGSARSPKSAFCPEDPRRVVAIVQVDSSTPIRADTRARLEYQGLTGVANIALTGGEPGAPPLVAGPGQPMPTIFADRSDFQDLIETARNIARRADDVLERVGPRGDRQRRRRSAGRSRTWSASRRLSARMPRASTASWPRSGRRPRRSGPWPRSSRPWRPMSMRWCAPSIRSASRASWRTSKASPQSLEQNRQAIANTLRNADTLVASLNQTAPKLDSAVSDLSNIAKAIDPAKVGRTVDKAEELANAIDGQRVSRIVENTDNFTQALGQNREVINNALRDAASLIASLNATAPKLDSAVAEIDELAKAIDPAKVGRTVDNLDTFSQMLSQRSPDVDKAIQEARSITEKLNKSADRIDSVLIGAEKFLGSASGESGKGAFDEIRAAAVSVRELADDLNRRTEGIQGVLSGVGRFTDSGLAGIRGSGGRGPQDLGRHQPCRAEHRT